MKRILFYFTLLLIVIPKNVFAINNSAHSMTVIDTDTNRILYQKNGNEKNLIASITKIMTAVIAIESGKINEIVEVDDTVFKAYGSGIYIKPGEEMSLLDMTYGLMLRSGNDAAMMIAKYVSGDIDKFVEAMNDKAQKIGMKNTKFCNPHGLDEECENISTSNDMALLSSYAIQNDIYKKIVSTKKYKLTTNKNTYVWNNKNKLVRTYKYTTGGKTGFTKKARRTLVTNASKNNLNISIVTLNDGNDFQDHKDAYVYIFKNYTKYRILNKDNFDVDNSNYEGNVYIENNYYYTIKESEKNKLSLDIKLEKNKKNIRNNIVGIVDVLFDGKVVHTENIYLKVIGDKKETGFWNKIIGWFK